MHREIPEDIKQLMERNISTECPYCGDTVSLIPQHDPINDFRDYSYFVAKCPNHKRLHCKPILAVYQALNDYICQRYPIPSFKATDLNEAIPYGIRGDYAEAKRCLYVDAYKGTAALCRRVIEAIACDKLQEKSKDDKGKTKKLFDLIDLMFSGGLITKDIKESAHEIRLFGNYGAHVQDDGLDNVAIDEARDIRSITWQIIDSIYIAPSVTKKLKEKREKKDNTDKNE